MSRFYKLFNEINFQDKFFAFILTLIISSYIFIFNILIFYNQGISENEENYLTIPKRKKSIGKAFIEYTTPIRAPIEKGDKLGSLSVIVEEELIKKVDIFSNEKINRTNIFLRILQSFNFLVWGDA